MSNRITIVAVMVIVAVSAALFYQLHRKEVSRASETEAPTITTHPATRPDAANVPGVETRLGASAAPKAGDATVDTKKGVDAASPLRAGESWQYAATVAKLSTVANLQLKVAEKRNFLGKSAWHLQAFAHTENPFRMIFALDDRFDSYSDATNLVSLQYEMHLNEKGQAVDSVQRMSPTNKEPAPADGAAARVLPGTRDPLGMMQYLRTVDWTKVAEVRSPVYDGHKLYDVYAKLAGKNEKVTVPAGSYSTMKIDLRVLDNGVEMKDAHFTLYLTNDEARTPVLLEALIPVATARVELLKGQ